MVVKLLKSNISICYLITYKKTTLKLTIKLLGFKNRENKGKGIKKAS